MKEVLAATRKISIWMSFFLLSLTLGCAPQAKQQVTEPAPHPHDYPFTEVIGDYHLRLVVDHADGEMALVFEDISEKPIKLVGFQRIKGEVTLPDGTVKEEIFRAVKTSTHSRHWTHKRAHPVVSKKRLVGIFTAGPEWIKTTPKFALEVIVPFKGRDYQLAFQYEAPAGKVPYHRR